MNALLLMERRLADRYRSDARGRLLCEQGPGRVEAPRFCLVRTPLGNLWRLRADVPAETATRLATLAGREDPLGESAKPPERLDFIRQALERDAPIEAERVDPVVSFPPDGALHGARDCVVRELCPGDADALHPELASCGVGRETLLQPDCLGVWFEGRVLAVAHTRFGGGGEVGEVWVVSAPAVRGRGYARAAVEAWCENLRGVGRTPVLTPSRAETKTPWSVQGFAALGEDRWWL